MWHNGPEKLFKKKYPRKCQKRLISETIKMQAKSYILYKFAQNEIKNFLRFCINYFRGKNLQRDTEYVYSLYETRRVDQLNNYTFTTLDEYIFGSPTSELEKRRWNLFGHKLEFGVGRKISDKKYSLIEEKINSTDIEYVVELGSGGGRNILFLANKYPEKNLLELSFRQPLLICLKELLKNLTLKMLSFMQEI